MRMGQEVQLVADVGHESDVTSSLDSNCKLSLMLSASTGDTAGKDLSSLRNVLSESCSILVIDLIDLVCTESTNLLSFPYYDYSFLIFGIGAQNGSSSSSVISSNLGADAAPNAGAASAP